MAGALRAFVLLGRMGRLLWEDAFTFILCNIFWLLLCLPVVTAPASFAALYYVAEMASRGKGIHAHDFWDGFRQYLGKGSLLGLIDLGLIVVLAVNLFFYSQLQSSLGSIVCVAWGVLAVFWAMVQVYLFPMLVVQIEPKIGWALRNAVMLSAAQPAFTFLVTLEALLVIAMTGILILPFLALGMSAVALLCCLALNDRLDALGARRPPAIPPDQDAG